MYKQNNNIIMEFKNFIVEYKDAISIVTMNRPSALNALNSDFFAEFNQFFNKKI